MARTQHSKRFATIKARYDKGYIRDDQLRQYVEAGAITPAEYKEITGEVYE